MSRSVRWGGLALGVLFWAAVLYWFGWWPLLVFFLGCAILVEVR